MTVDLVLQDAVVTVSAFHVSIRSHDTHSAYMALYYEEARNLRDALRLISSGAVSVEGYGAIGIEHTINGVNLHLCVTGNPGDKNRVDYYYCIEIDDEEKRRLVEMLECV